MTRKIVLAGGSGLVGRQTAEFLALGGWEVHLVLRRPLAALDPLIHTHIAPNPDWPAIVAGIKADVAISCLGTTIRNAGSRDAFRAVDLDLVLAFAEAGYHAGARHFITVSSVGAVPASSSFYLRTKAEMEQGLRNYGFQRLDIMRPSLLTGGHRDDHRPGEALGILLSPVTDMLMIGPLKKFASTPSDSLAKAIAALASGKGTGIFIHENDEIDALAS